MDLRLGLGLRTRFYRVSVKVMDKVRVEVWNRVRVEVRVRVEGR